MAHVASERLDQMQDPEKSIVQAIVDYKRLGYSDAWINQRIKSIEVRNGVLMAKSFLLRFPMVSVWK